MPREGYIRELREHVGTMTLLMPSVSVIVRDPDGRIVVGRHCDTRRWVIPGGALEPGERPVDCGRREVWEETGLRVDVVGLRGVYGGVEHRVEYPNGDACDYMVAVFDAVVSPGTSARLPGSTPELTELRWVSDAELAALDAPPWLHSVLAHPVGWEPGHWEPPA